MTAHMHAERKQNWGTPPDLFAALVNRFGAFDLDACAERWSKQVYHAYVLPEQDGLHLPWVGRTFCNPPFSQMPKWAKKAIDERNDHGVETVMVAKASTGSAYWHDLILPNSTTYLLRTRVAFVAPPGEKNKDRPNYDTVIYHFGPNVARGGIEAWDWRQS